MSITRRHFVTRFVPGVALALALRPAIASPSASFDYGVASGDPTATGILLWTRVTPRFDGETEVNWQVASDPDFETVLARGTTSTTAARDYTVKVEVDGLEPGRSFFYRFDSLGAVSQTGRSKTLPVGELGRYTLGVCSCSNYPAGYFNAYGLMAQTDSIDAVLHLGDYLYEYDKAGYASQRSRAMGRESLPGHEIVSLSDYRARHAQYKSDSDLQDAHARHPFITVWDDHETANDSYVTGAQNHDASEGDWAARKAAAVQAYYEWMPIREPAQRDRSAIYRAFEIGDLATLVMLETRNTARTQPADAFNEMVFRSVDFDFSDPENPIALPGGRPASLDPAFAKTIPVPFDLTKASPQPVLDFARIQSMQSDDLPPGFAYLPDTGRFRAEVLADPSRRLMDDVQKEFITTTLGESTRARKPWQIIGNQVLMSQMASPNLLNEMTREQIDQLPEYIRPYIEFSKFGLPLSTDGWDGYDAERQWMCDAFRTTGSTPVVVTGDSHAAWAMEVRDPRSGQTAALEIGTTSISSPGDADNLGISGERIAELMMEKNSNIRFADVVHRGFTTLTLTPDGAEANYHVVDTVFSRQYSADIVKTMRLEPGRGKAPTLA
ncbi:MAG: alkaline phosphatase D family protein [Pseudomonadota bacterium]